MPNLIDYETLQFSDAAKMMAHYAQLQERFYPKIHNMQRLLPRSARIGAKFMRASVVYRMDAAPLDARASITLITRTVCRHFKITKEQLLERTNKPSICEPRQIAMYLARDLAKKPFPYIARRFGLGDHTTALHAASKIRNKIQTSEKMRNDVEAIRRRILMHAR